MYLQEQHIIYYDIVASIDTFSLCTLKQMSENSILTLLGGEFGTKTVTYRNNMIKYFPNRFTTSG